MPRVTSTPQAFSEAVLALMVLDAPDIYGLHLGFTMAPGELCVSAPVSAVGLRYGLQSFRLFPLDVNAGVAILYAHEMLAELRAAIASVQASDGSDEALAGVNFVRYPAVASDSGEPDRQRLAADFLAALMRERRPGESVGVEVDDDEGLDLWVTVAPPLGSAHYTGETGHYTMEIDYEIDGLDPADVERHVAETFRRARRKE